ncbi:type 1 fimbrial protein [Yersinia pestis]|uniref:Fimbrial A protein n=13 Tax=Yersinia pestis TaxID=632 RepID=A0AAX2I305_YERPE|nr:fimbrial protein [Yersinia pestis]EDR33546.1 fimbrial protein [Yersinia pestis biovar Orientalis str. IP275]EFA49400.1 fimbrial protein [Yersinia pestis KIM D27]ERP71412.1 fimbria A protein [Yersinia pestis S3]ERP72135.1 fimbria A protein [Yersinia pestis 24H]AAM85162.1 fimbrial A protein precursor [Yersinia pestis KIM10+]
MSNFKKSVLVAAVLSLSAFAANAADQGKGKVTFTGSIIEAPCSITSEAADQVVELGQISTTSLANMGSSEPRSFSIGLEKCDVATMKNVSVTFDGTPDGVDAEMLKLIGLADGAGIVITDEAGATIKRGVASVGKTLDQGSNSLKFSAYLKGTSADEGSVVPGEFSSVANFTLAYN